MYIEYIGSDIIIIDIIYTSKNEQSQACGRTREHKFKRKYRWNDGMHAGGLFVQTE